MCLPNRVLLVGSDYQSFQFYWLYNNANGIISAFLDISRHPIPFDSILGRDQKILKIYTEENISIAIKENKINTCIIYPNNVQMIRLKSIIHKILSLNCNIEFPKLNDISLVTFKPTFIVNSIAPKLGRSQISHYLSMLCSKELFKVAIVMPFTLYLKNEQTIQGTNHVFNFATGPYYEIKDIASIPQNLSQYDINQVKLFLASGAYCIYLTSDINRALIAAEQVADAIIFESPGCGLSYIQEDNKRQETICVFSESALLQFNQNSLFTGLVNFFYSQHLIDLELITVKHSGFSYLKGFDLKSFIGKNIGTRKLHSAYSLLIHQSRRRDSLLSHNPPNILNSSVSESETPSFNAHQKSVGEFEEPSKSLFLSGINSGDTCSKESVFVDSFREMSPCIDLSSMSFEEETPSWIMIPQQLADTTINHKNEVILFQNSEKRKNVCENPFINHKLSVSSLKEISDPNRTVEGIIMRYIQFKPTLQKHFESQVDVLNSLLEASNKEMSVTNHESANKNAFCRLFLSSHLPPGYRVTDGEMIDCQGNHTSRFEIVIVNDECPPMTIVLPKNRFFGFNGFQSEKNDNDVIAPILADSVLCTIEVKSNLTFDGLKKSLSRLRQVKALMPQHATLETPDGDIIPDPLEGKIIAGIFALNSSSDIADKFMDAVRIYPDVCDFIVFPASNSINGAPSIFNKNLLEICSVVKRDDQNDEYVKFASKGAGLATLFGVLNAMASMRRFSRENYVKYLTGNWHLLEKIQNKSD